MHRLKRVTPSPSMIIAIIALIVAVSGSAIAATMINGSNIKNGTIPGAKLKNNSVTGAKVKNGSLSAADLSVAAQSALKGQVGATGPAGVSGPAGVLTTWSRSIYTNIVLVPNTGGAVAHLTFTSPTAGFVRVDARFAVRVHNTAGTDCRVSSQINSLAGAPDPAIGPGALSAPGFADQWINGNLPTQNGAGTFLGLSQSAFRILPVVAGVNNIFLNGIHSCAGVIWGPITLTADLVQNNPAATLTAN